MLSRRHLRAFMKNPDAEKSNAIHSTSGARDYGFQGALVGGATAYGWAASFFVETLGNQWLNFGWVQVRFRQPIYPNDDLVVILGDDGLFDVRRDIDEVSCLSGRVGRGEAPWLGDVGSPSRRPPEPMPDCMPDLTLRDAPLGEELRTREVHLSVADAEAYARDKQQESLDCFFGSDASIHPAWIAEQPIHWLHHSYNYGPSIHTESRIQHLRRGKSVKPIVSRGFAATRTSGKDTIPSLMTRKSGPLPTERLPAFSIRQYFECESHRRNEVFRPTD